MVGLCPPQIFFRSLSSILSKERTLSPLSHSPPPRETSRGNWLFDCVENWFVNADKLWVHGGWEIVEFVSAGTFHGPHN